MAFFHWENTGVSVLLSVYHKESPVYLCQSLDSIFNQDLLPSEVILMKDGTLTKHLDFIIEEYSKKFHQLKIVSLPVNQGLGKALNEGLKHCSYDLVARMDTDDIAMPDRNKGFSRASGIRCSRSMDR